MGSQSNLPERTIYRTWSSKIFSWMTSPFTLLYFTLLYFTLPYYLVPLASISLIWLYIEQPCPVPFILALLYSSWLIFDLLCPVQSCPIPRCALYTTMRYTHLCAIRYHALFVLCTAIRCVLLPSNLSHSYSIKPALLLFCKLSMMAIVSQPCLL